MFVDYEGIYGVYKKELVEKGRQTQQKTEEYSFRVEHKVEGTSKRTMRLENRNYNSFFAMEKNLMSKSKSAHLVDAEAGLKMAMGENNS